MKRSIRICALALAAAMTLSLSSCFHDNWNLPEREEPDINLGALLGMVAPPLGSTELLPSGIVLTLSEDGSYYTVTDASRCTASVVSIPSSYKGLPVKGIGSGAFEGLEELSEIKLPDSVTFVGSSAFEGCDSLKYNVYEGSRYLGNGKNPYLVLISVTQNVLSSKIHEDTRVIADAACIGNSLVKELVVPDGVVTVGNNAFSNCLSLRSVVIGNGVETVGDGAFSRTKISELSIGDSVKSIGANAFYNIATLKSLNIPDSVTEIGENAFFSCTALETLELGEGLKTIGRLAFARCGKLSVIDFGGSLETIDDEAFRECHSLGKVSLPHTIENIAHSAFFECSILNYHVFETGLYLGSDENPFEYLMGTDFGITYPEMSTVKRSLLIHPDTRRVARGLFADSEPTNILIVDGKYLRVSQKCLIDIAEGKVVAGIAGATIPMDKSVTSIGDYAFYGIEGFKSTVIQSNITSIGEHAFEKCTGIYSLTIKGDVTIGAYAFSECTSMYAVKFTKEAKYIGDYAFSRCTSLSNISIPDTVEYLGRSAFEGCFALTEAYIGSRVSAIPDNAFLNCKNLKAVKLGDAPKSIGDGAFMECYSLSHFTFNEGIEYIGDRAFYLCEALPYLTLPESLLGIGEMAFAGCGKLRWLNLGTRLQELGNLAFHGIPMNLDVKYRGTMQMWQKIDNAHNIYKGEQKLRVICSDGEIVLEPDDVIITVYAPD